MATPLTVACHFPLGYFFLPSSPPRGGSSSSSPLLPPHPFLSLLPPLPLPLEYVRTYAPHEEEDYSSYRAESPEACDLQQESRGALMVHETRSIILDHAHTADRRRSFWPLSITRGLILGHSRDFHSSGERSSARVRRESREASGVYRNSDRESAICTSAVYLGSSAANSRNAKPRGFVIALNNLCS